MAGPHQPCIRCRPTHAVEDLGYVGCGVCVLMVDPDAVSVEGHPSTTRPPTMFSEIKIDAKDWSNLLRVSSVAKSMLACTSPPFPWLWSGVDGGEGICVDCALVVYVYVTDDVGGE